MVVAEEVHDPVDEQRGEMRADWAVVESCILVDRLRGEDELTVFGTQ
jgi:hypothetical protein